MRAAAAILLVARAAFAQAPGGLAPPAKTGLDAAQEAAASNHGLIGSTALTVPGGTVELTGGLIVPIAAAGEINAGLTRSTEVWVDAAAVIDISDDGDGGRTYAAGVKQVLARGDQAAIALTGSVRGLPDNGQSGYQSAGAVATLCADADCTLMVSAAFQRLFGAHFNGGARGANAVTVSASVGNKSARLMADVLALDGDPLLFVGARFGNRTTAVDLAIMSELQEHDGVALPWVAVSVRL